MTISGIPNRHDQSSAKPVELQPPADVLRAFARHAGDWLRPKPPDGLQTPYSLIQLRTALLAGADALERLADLEGEYELTKAHFTDFADEALAARRKLEGQRDAARDELADVSVYSAELWDLLGRSNDQQCQGCGCSPRRQPHQPACRVAAALEVSPPARGREVLAELERLRAAIDAMTPVVARSLAGSGPRSSERALAEAIASHIDVALAKPAATREAGR